MSLKVTVQLPPSLRGHGAIEALERNKEPILFEGGMGVFEKICDHLRMLSAVRHRAGAKGKGHFDPDQDRVKMPVTTGDSVKVAVCIPGITRALHPITIRPVEAKMLAIPVHDDAYGMQPREYSLYYPAGSEKALFMIRKTKAGNTVLARREGKKNIVAMYVLKDQVSQPQDPSLMPDEKDLLEKFKNRICAAVRAVLERGL